MSAETNFQEFIKRVGINEADLTKLCDEEKHFGFGKINLIACPWISLWCEKQKHKDEVEGIFMMQDWWKKENDDVTLESQVKYLNECLDGDTGDQTLKNFLNNKHQWKKLVDSGTWLVTNAVWALRSCDAKATGYLCDSIHRKAFPFWVKVVLHFAKHDNFKLVIAGEWGIFNKKKTPRKINDYLIEWVEWSEQKSNKALVEKIGKAQGIVQFCPHPFTWNFISFDLIRGPD
jgi:hypothetical protein